MARQDGSQPALGRAIRALRTENEVSQAVLAERAGLTVAALSRVERGRTNPTWGTIVALATALGTTVSNLAARAEAL